VASGEFTLEYTGDSSDDEALTDSGLRKTTEDESYTETDAETNINTDAEENGTHLIV
jgi:hypothetical protein